MSESGQCSLGLLTPVASPHCLTPLSNDILCAVELAFGLLIVARLATELHRVSPSMRIMLTFYICNLLSDCAMCSLALAHVNEKTNGQYVLWTLAHVFCAFGITTRMHVFVKVVCSCSSIQKVQFNPAVFSIGVFAVTSVFCAITAVLWAFAPLYASVGSLEPVRRAGFVVYGTFVLVMSILLFSVSRFVIGFYVGLVNGSDPSEKRRREKGAAILKQMTAVTCGAMFFTSLLYFLVGGISGALRNEVAHAMIWLTEVAMLPLIRFVRQCAEIRVEQQSKRDSKASHEAKSVEPTSTGEAPRRHSTSRKYSTQVPTPQKIVTLSPSLSDPEDRLRKLSAGPLRLSVGMSAGSEYESSTGRLSVSMSVGTEPEKHATRSLLVEPGGSSARSDKESFSEDDCRTIQIEIP